MLTEKKKKKRSVDLSMLKEQIAMSKQEASCVLRPLPCKRRHANLQHPGTVFSPQKLPNQPRGRFGKGQRQTKCTPKVPPYLFSTVHLLKTRSLVSKFHRSEPFKTILMREEQFGTLHCQSLIKVLEDGDENRKKKEKKDKKDLSRTGTGQKAA
ncbi:hypothetical protein CEXT_88911 [Caerostris extrusa]|uniref:Uncharacterized protein n=1 Tax=Caerostris extrusa TaxID=172846 RepID=A0AAV4YGC3_CAEEX|nr:hypothetical protein CEXT_88911 [Caerostris extrusa]